MAREMELLYRTEYLELVSSGHWQWVNRPHPVVCVIAVTEGRELLLIEQFRVPVDGQVIELPAGLVGDDENSADEPVLDAARRELLEETGYEAATMRELFVGVTSAGLTNETTTFVLASGLRKVSEQLGAGDERIERHLAPLDGIDDWLLGNQARGCKVDARVLTGIYLLQHIAPR